MLKPCLLDGRYLPPRLLALCSGRPFYSVPMKNAQHHLSSHVREYFIIWSIFQNSLYLKLCGRIYLDVLEATPTGIFEREDATS